MKGWMLAAVVGSGVMAALPAQAQSIYKCVEGTAITYQQSPCEAPPPPKGVSSQSALIGTWRYDHDLTLAWMKRHATMTKLEQAELDGLAGHVTYVFAHNLVTIDITDYDIAIGGAVQHKKGTHRIVQYTVMSSSPQVVTVSAQNPNTLSVYTTAFHLQAHDTMWISLAQQKLTSVADADAREYFVRVH